MNEFTTTLKRWEIFMNEKKGCDNLPVNVAAAAAAIHTNTHDGEFVIKTKKFFFFFFFTSSFFCCTLRVLIFIDNNISSLFRLHLRMYLLIQQQVCT